MLTDSWQQIVDERNKLNEGLRERGFYPQLKYPADVFILQLAGADTSEILAENSIGKRTYHVFAKNADGSRILTSNGDGFAYVVREWAPEQRAVIRKHWHLLSPEARYGD